MLDVAYASAARLRLIHRSGVLKKAPAGHRMSCDASDNCSGQRLKGRGSQGFQQMIEGEWKGSEQASDGGVEHWISTSFATR
jgi:hypothetical protein